MFDYVSLLFFHLLKKKHGVLTSTWSELVYRSFFIEHVGRNKLPIVALHWRYIQYWDVLGTQAKLKYVSEDLR